MINAPTVTIDIMRVNGKRVNATLFRQLYEEKPFNSEFDLLHEIKGKIFHKNEFVLFNTPNGLRKFNISNFKTKYTANSLESNLFCILHEELTSPQLEHMRAEVYSYYSNLVGLTEEDSYERLVIAPMLSGKVGLGKHERCDCYAGLLNSLTWDFKDRIQIEYEKALAKLERRNQLIDVFINVPQIFI